MSKTIQLSTHPEKNICSYNRVYDICKILKTCCKSSTGCTRDVPVDLSRESGTGGDTGHVAVARVGQLEDPEYDVVQRLLSCCWDNIPHSDRRCRTVGSI